jgi:hypothetical protein
LFDELGRRRADRRVQGRLWRFERAANALLLSHGANKFGHGLRGFVRCRR